MPTTKEQATAATDPENVVRKQFGEDSQLDTMGALAMIQFARTFDEELYDSAVSSEPGNKNKMLSVLNWIANSFVREAQGDVVATALSATALSPNNNKLTLYIAMNRGRPTQVDKKNSLEFLAALRTALTRDSRNAARQDLVSAAFSASAARVQRKLSMISRMHFSRSSDPITPFESFVDKWEGKGGTEAPRTLQEHQDAFPRILVPTANAALKSIFGQLISRIKRFGPSKLQLDQQLCALCTLATTLCQSTFFTTLPERKQGSLFDVFGHEEHAWLLKLRRRLWQFAHYLTDADAFVSHGFKYIRGVLGESRLDAFVKNGAGFEIVWVGDEVTLPANHGRQYMWPESPVDRLRCLLEAYGIIVDEEKLKNKEFASVLQSVWNADLPIRPFLHCELQLIEYLQSNDITVWENAIGVSKLMCYACNVYVNLLNDAARQSQPTGSRSPWLLSGTSRKAHHAWLIAGDPEGPLRSRVLSQIQDQLKERITTLAQKNRLGRPRANGGASDSSAGSKEGSVAINRLYDEHGRTIGRFDD